MRKLLALLFVSLAIPTLASNTYIYAPGLDSAIQHWQYPTTVAMTTDFGFYAQDIGKIAFNKGDGIYYYLSDTIPTWIPMATGGGGGSTTFLGLIDTPDDYTGQAGKLVVVNGTATGLIFQTAAGGGNVSNVGTPAADEMAVWTDATHIKGVRTLAGGPFNGYVLTKLSGTDFDYGWTAPTAGSTVSITATSPIVVTPSPVTGTGVISLDAATDLGALEALTGTNTIYYRSGVSTWSPVVIGSNLTFSSGTLAASTGGSGTNAFGTITVSGQTDVVAEIAPDTLTLVAGTNVTITTNAATDTVTIASSGGASGVTSVSATSPIQVSPSPITSTGTISLESGSDLFALEALTGTNTMYYRSGVSAWSAVTIGSNMTFSAGSLAAGNANWDTAYTERRQWDGSSTNLNATLGRSNLGATTIGGNLFTQANPTVTSWIKISSLGAITLEDAATTKTSLGLNTANWDTAYTDRMKWDTSLGISGGTTGQGRTALGATTTGSNLFTLGTPASTSWMKVSSLGAITLEDAATTKSSLALTKSDVGLVNVTNDVQTQAVVVPNTIPTDGQLLVGVTANNKYLPRTITGSGATVSMGSTGVLSISAIPNTTLSNDTITISGTGVSLGGTITRDNVMGTTSGLGYLKRTAAQTYTASTTAIPNGDLANSSITVGNASATALGGSVSADQVIGTTTGLGYMKRTLANTYTATTTSIPNADLANSTMTFANAGVALGGTVTSDNAIGLAAGTGLVKRSGASNYTIAVAGTDFKSATQASVKVVMLTATAGGTYTVPAAVVSLYVEGVGGGGGGGAVKCTASSTSGGGGGGGGGGYSAVFIASPAATYAWDVGAGGNGGAVTGGSGTSGGNTTFGAVITAGGGGGGTGGGGCSGSAGLTANGGAGGTSSVGGSFSSGSQGAVGYNLNSTEAIGGNGGASRFATLGIGGICSGATQQVGATGNNYGGGGGGNGVNTTAATFGGGDGAPGVIRVWEIY